MKYDFTSILDRRGRDAIAVDGLKGDGFSPAPPKAGFDAIPMWVADMNFPTVPTIQEAIIERAKHPAESYRSGRGQFQRVNFNRASVLPVSVYHKMSCVSIDRTYKVKP